MENITYKNVYGHYEIYFCGKLIATADNYREAKEEAEEFVNMLKV